MPEKNYYFNSSKRSDFHIIDNLSIAVNTFFMQMLTSLSADEIRLPMYKNLLTNLIGLVFNVEMALSCLKHLNSVLFDLT